MTGSVYNLKPDSVLEALCNEIDIPYSRFDYHIHRIETYMLNEQQEYVSLLCSGETITNEML